MTDEEMAEEYAKLNARQYIHNDGISFCTSEEEVKQAFLAGLKAKYDTCLSAKYDVCLRENTGLKIHNTYVEKKLTKAKELLKWALHSDPEHDGLNEFDAKWAEARQFLEEEEK